MLSLQNTNMEALAEWVEFTERYDPDHKIMIEADKAMKSGNPWDIPENYHYTYGCYSNYICEGGILESSADDGESGAHYAYYTVTADGVEMIERVVREPYYEYWGYAVGGQDGKTISEEKAMSIINSYKRIELDMKPFSQYPFK